MRLRELLKRWTVLCGLTAALLLLSGCPPSDSGSDGGAEPDLPPDVSERQGVILEVDRMEGTTALQDTQQLNGQTVSLAGIYDAAEFDVDVRHDQDNIPRQEEVNLADLHALMTANRLTGLPEDAWHVYALVVTEDADDSDTLGIMFDFGSLDVNDVPREAFAIFESAHEDLPGGVIPEMLLTTAHEMAHCFNLHHPDWEGSSFTDDSTVEGYSLTDSVRWQLSQQSVTHIAAHHQRLVRPGGESLPFGLVTQAHLDSHQSSPSESFQVVDPGTLSHLARGSELAKSMAVRSALARNRPETLAPEDGPLRLEIGLPRDSFEVGEAIVATVTLSNTGTEEVSVRPLLDVEYGFLTISLRGPDESEFHPFRPAVLKEGRGVAARSLAPGENLYSEAKVFFGADGWSFQEPGSYALRADFPATAEEPGPRIESPEVTFTVTEPTSEASTTARNLLAAAEGEDLGTEQGLFLLFGGGDHLVGAVSKLKELVSEAPDAPQAPACRLALARAALSPTIDPARRVKPEARLEEATGYLQGIPEERLSTRSLVTAQAILVEELEQAGQTEEAARIRQDALSGLERKGLSDSERQDLVILLEEGTRKDR